LVKIDESNIRNIRISNNINTITAPIQSMHIAGTINIINCTFSKNKGNVAAISALFLEKLCRFAPPLSVGKILEVLK
jgi:hypothetical protein